MSMQDRSDRTIGTLADFEIAAHSEKHDLIEEGFDARRVKQACYELTAGSVYYDLSDNKKRHEVKKGEYVLVKPKQLLVVITSEKLRLAPDMLGRILTKGHLFSLGLMPVNTYADPGFSGHLGIVLYNVSNHYIKLPQGEPIAKIEFCRLQYPVRVPYHGQHGYETQIWPIRDDLVLSDGDVASDPRVKSVVEEIELAYGPGIGRVMRRVFAHERRLFGAASIYLVATLALIGLTARTGWMSPALNVGLGILANIVWAGTSYLATNLKRR